MLVNQLFLASCWAEMTDADDYSISISQVFS
jgi:hypothetical protein